MRRVLVVVALAGLLAGAWRLLRTSRTQVHRINQ